jgi:geranylgeranyl diphosphate synthase type I
MNLKSELQKRTDEFNKYWIRYFPQKTPPRLYQAARHLPLAGGKRLRPFLAMYACESVGGNAEQVFPFAASLEIMHNFTLVHDDIMDKSYLRRNYPTVHTKYGEPTAILAGDFLFAKAFEAMHDIDVDPAVFKELDYGLIECVLGICEGQQLDMEFEKRTLISEEEYIDMISKKTAILFRLAGRGGAILGKATTEERDTLTDYGLLVGLAFQIWDDVLDISSDEETLGKDIGNDIRNGKKTLIAVHTLHHATGKNKKILDDFFGNQEASDEDIRKVFSLFKELGSIEYAKKTAASYAEKAKQTLPKLKESKAKDLLFNLADYSINREN